MSRTVSLTQVIAWICYGIVGINIVLTFVPFEGFVRPTMTNMLLILAWFLLSLGSATTFLTFFHWRTFTDWRVWVALIAMFIAGGLVMFDTIDIPHRGLALLLVLVFLFGGWSLFLALIITLVRFDVSLVLLAVSSTFVIWSIVINWAVFGNVIEQALLTPTTEQPSVLAWSNTLLNCSCCLVPFALLSLVWHTLLFLKREIYREIPPVSGVHKL